MEKEINEISEIKKDISTIKNALLGDEYNPGFKQRIETVEVRARENAISIQKFKIISITVGGALTLVGTIIGIVKNWPG